MKITDNFDGGNIQVVNKDVLTNIELKIRNDSNSDFLQWFYFRVEGAQFQHCIFSIINAGDAAYPEAWENYNARISYDRENWFTVATSFVDNQLKIDFTPEYNSVYISYFAPFSYEQHLSLVHSAQLSPLCELESLGTTCQGRSIDFLRIGDDDINKKKLWVIARQHPGETMAEWFMLGLIERLLDEEDSASAQLLKKANMFLVPNMNIDGSILGNLRVNANGVNLNREWSKPDKINSPEVYFTKQKMQEIGMDFNLDVHGDEALPYVFISGIEGIPSFDAKLQFLTDKFMSNWKIINPDLQDEYGYPKNKKGDANLDICSKRLGEDFKCLSQTLEMPFKQNDNIPDNLMAWSPERSMQLGESLIATLLSIVDDL